jgi:hypothetical protein
MRDHHFVQTSSGLNVAVFITAEPFLLGVVRSAMVYTVLLFYLLLWTAVLKLSLPQVQQNYLERIHEGRPLGEMFRVRSLFRCPGNIRIQQSLLF